MVYRLRACALVFLCSFLSVILCSLCAPARADIHYLNPGDSITAAINSVDPGDVIILNPGTYTENVIWNEKSLIIRGVNESEKPIIRGSSWTSPVFTCTNVGQSGTAALRLVILMPPVGTPPSEGAAPGLLVENCRLNFRMVEFREFRESQGTVGGGAARVTGGSISRFWLCVFENNQSTRGGGAVSVSGCGSLAEPMWFEECTFTNNSCDGPGYGTLGGALRLSQSVFLVSAGTVFTGNEADSGGAVGVLGGSDGSFDDCAFTGNHARCAGGAEYLRGNWDAAVPPVNHTACAYDMNACDLDWTHEPARGGAVAVTASHVSFADGCLFTDNEANRGGAVALFQTDAIPDEKIVIMDCEFRDNHATAGFVGCDPALPQYGETQNWPCLDGGALYANGNAFDVITPTTTPVEVTIGGSGGPGTYTTVFGDNSAQFLGGAVFLSAAKVSMANAEFAGNQAYGAGGGAVEVSCCEEIRISDCSFVANEAACVETDGFPSDWYGIGGAISFLAWASQDLSFIHYPPQAEGPCSPVLQSWEDDWCAVEQCQFSGNRAHFGGALGLGHPRCNLPKQPKVADLTVTGCDFSDDVAQVNGGAVMCWFHSGSTDLGLHRYTENYFRSNGAEGVYPWGRNCGGVGGGAFSIRGGIQVEIDHNEFVENTSLTLGGALLFEENCDYPVKIHENTFRGNQVRSCASEQQRVSLWQIPGARKLYNLRYPPFSPRFYFGMGGAVCTVSGLIQATGNQFYENRVLVPQETASETFGGAGGAVAMVEDVGLPFVLDNNVLIGNFVELEGGVNTLGVQGGGILMEYRDDEYGWELPIPPGEAGFLEASNNVLAGNSAVQGGGIFVWEQSAGEDDVWNNILLCNEAVEGAGIYGQAPPPPGSGDYGVAPDTYGWYAHNDVYDNPGGNWGGVFDSATQALHGNLSADPEFSEYTCGAVQVELCDFTIPCDGACAGSGHPDTPGEDCYGMKYDMGIFGGEVPCAWGNPCSFPIEFYDFTHTPLGLNPHMVRVDWSTAQSVASQIRYTDPLTGLDHLVPDAPSVGTSHWATFPLVQGNTYVLDGLAMPSTGYGCVDIAGVYSFCVGGDGLGDAAKSTAASVDASRIEFDLASDAPVSISIYDLQGRKVRSIDCGQLTGGGHSILWGSRDDGGRPVPAGTYFYVVRGADVVRQGRLLIVR